MDRNTDIFFLGSLRNVSTSALVLPIVLNMALCIGPFLTPKAFLSAAINGVVNLFLETSLSTAGSFTPTSTIAWFNITCSFSVETLMFSLNGNSGSVISSTSCLKASSASISENKPLVSSMFTSIPLPPYSTVDSIPSELAISLDLSFSKNDI